ncbi:MAG: hypothetical protein AAFP81_19235 [Pseudomonadota bacterium]
MSLHIRKADNGFIVEVTKPSRIDPSIGSTNTHVFETGNALLAFVTQHLIDPCVGVPVASPEQPEGAPASMPVEPDMKSISEQAKVARDFYNGSSD